MDSAREALGTETFQYQGRELDLSKPFARLTIVEATVDGSGLLIAFNVKFLREALEVIRTPNVALETSAPNAPATCTRT